MVVKKIIFLFVFSITFFYACSDKNKNHNNQSKNPISHPTKDSTSHEGIIILIEALGDIVEAVGED